MIDLQPFCGTDEARHYLMKPFSKDGFTWATDGHILVRVARRADVEAFSAGIAMNIARSLASHEGAKFLPFPQVSWPPTPSSTCEICMGSGKDPDDDTELCFECEGSGDTPQSITVTVRGVIFQTRYLRLIEALPNAEFALRPNPPAKNRRDTEPTPFRFDGGFGALMPMGNEGRIHLGDIKTLVRAA